MTEIEAETKIKAIIPTSIKGEVIEVIKRDEISGNRLKHTAIFAVIFKHSKSKALEMITAAKQLSINEPDLVFSGSDVDDKFKLENSAVFITAICK